MSLMTSAIRLVEHAPLPDPMTRIGIAALVGRTRQRLAESPPDADMRFAQAMTQYAIAEQPDAANAQHYELPPDFFRLTLGPHRKYSCCLYGDGVQTLAEAEIRALEATVDHAGVADGQRILELGCGWGSLTLFMAERYPNATIVAVSNAASQRNHIMREAVSRGLSNITVLTADVNDFQAAQTFDRIVSVEMFEHMANWQALLTRLRSWLTPEGRVFLHVFTHRSAPYRFDTADKADWIAQHFFTGGIMPSHGLIRQFAGLFAVEQEWNWDGSHYQRTAEEWLANFDANIADIDIILQETYGEQARLWRRRWRLFYLATAGLFGHAGGTEWGVSHYLLRPAAS